MKEKETVKKESRADYLLVGLIVILWAITSRSVFMRARDEDIVDAFIILVCWSAFTLLQIAALRGAYRIAEILHP